MPSPSLVLLRTQSDARLVALAREGHERAFEAIVERYRRQLLRSCRRVLPEGRAEDALQQALMAAWRGIVRGDEVRELRPWLHRIAHNTSLNLLRQTGYDYDELQESLRIADAPDDELERRAVVRQTLHGLASLPPRQRDALLAIAVDGRSQEEVAGDLGLSTGAVRQLVHRARTTLRAAATALVPLPLVSAVAAGSRGELTTRIAELSAGAGGVGASAALAKAGTVAVIAGGAVAGPALVQKRASGPQTPSAAAATAPRGDREMRSPRERSPRSVTVSAPATEPPRSASEPRSTPTATPRRTARRVEGGGGSGPSSRSGSPVRERDDDELDDRGSRSGPSGGDDGGLDRSGPSDDGGTERDDRSGSDSGSGSGSRSGSSGPGSGDDHELAEPEPSATASPELSEEPEIDSSGPGSGGGEKSGPS